jgi:hypothetical protein
VTLAPSDCPSTGQQAFGCYKAAVYDINYDESVVQVVEITAPAHTAPSQLQATCSVSSDNGDRVLLGCIHLVGGQGRLWQSGDTFYVDFRCIEDGTSGFVLQNAGTPGATDGTTFVRAGPTGNINQPTRLEDESITCVTLDSDNDGLNDGYERLHSCLDRLVADALLDPDSDGLATAAERAIFTDPCDIDTDDDELGDGAETQVHGTDPRRPDTDADRLFDGAEVNEYGTDPKDADTDDDGVTDGNEVVTFGSDPLSTDSDSDLLPDGDEVSRGTNPVNADSDGDSLTDGAEVLVHGTNPLLADTDSDTLEDGLEIRVRLDPLAVDSDGDNISDDLEDHDGDMLKNGEEIHVYGTRIDEPDTDDDRCGDGEEASRNPLAGGDRNPTNEWDFFDVTSDGRVDLSDALDILGYFGDPAPPASAAFARDRSMPDTRKPWRSGKPGDGQVDLADALINLNSFGHVCDGLP